MTAAVAGEEGIRTLMYRDALNEALKEEMRRDLTVFCMGEGIAERGGSYKVTDGLLEEFGGQRVFDTPIAEASFTGAGVGAGDTLQPSRSPQILNVRRAVNRQSSYRAGDV